ncbi:hypothetical protein J6590_068681 [Homalodisca vitripennis]|nr:hypothetical protein J6590_068681 [Homalodisca vitripennis]
MTQRLRDVLNSFGLEWAVNLPTRVTATSSTAIDNVITNISTAVVSVLDTAIADHFARRLPILGVRPEPEHQTKKLKRSLHPRNVDSLFQKNPGLDFLKQ